MPRPQIWLSLLLASLLAAPAWGDGPVSQKAVDKAINAGARALLKQQRPDGSWVGPNLMPPHIRPGFPRVAGNREGITAIALLALLASDVKPTHPAIKKGFGVLYKMRMAREKGAPAGRIIGLTYDEAVVCMALHKWSEALGKKKRRGKPADPEARTCYLSRSGKAWLKAVASDLSVSHTDGAWGYQIRRATTKYSTFSSYSPKKGGSGTRSPMHGRAGKKPKGSPKNLGAVGKIDYSNTQYAVLGMRAAEMCGIGIAGDTWQQVLTYFINNQEGGAADPSRRLGPTMSSGRRAKNTQPRGWGYEPRHPGTVTMTSCGVAMLAIAREQLAFHRKLGRGDAAKAQIAIDDGIAWLGVRWALEGSEGPGRDPRNTEKLDRSGIDGYLLYGLERAGILGKVEKMGTRVWYDVGATRILERQRRDGSWIGMHGTTVETAFALLFLKRATRPIVVKIELTGGSDDK